jgi:hypothetical protein
MNRKRVLQIILGGLLAVIYIAAKIDTFRRLDLHKPGIFFRTHVLYWVAAAVIVFLLCLTEKFLDRPSKPGQH